MLTDEYEGRPGRVRLLALPTDLALSHRLALDRGTLAALDVEDDPKLEDQYLEAQSLNLRRMPATVSSEDISSGEIQEVEDVQRFVKG